VEDAMKKTQRLKIATAAAALTAVCCVPAYAQTAAPAPAQKAAPATTTTATPPAAQKPTPAEKATPASPAPAQARAAGAPVVPAGIPTPPDYVIGPDDMLTIVFWREKDMSSDVSVRPDGKISLPLINDVQASGLTPEQLRVNVTEAASKFVEDPAVTVVVKAINSRKVFITGQVAKPGPFALGGPTTVLQLIATAGGVGEYSKSDKIVIMRTENGKTVSHKFNYKDVIQGKNLVQNIELKPGDTIIVP
jgi:polysaccharide export outer membrane protein